MKLATQPQAGQLALEQALKALSQLARARDASGRPQRPQRPQSESERDLFASCDLTGRVQLFPQSAARIHLALEELQLVPFRPLTEPRGVHHEEGALDLSLCGENLVIIEPYVPRRAEVGCR